MQQQPPPALGSAPPPSFSPNAITTEEIQKYLDENKKLIMAILENQNLGKLAECAQYQALLQKNLMFLAAMADAQPQIAAMPSQMPSHPVVQQGNFMQQTQAGMPQQHGVVPKMPFQLNALQSQDQQHQLLQFQQQHGLRPGAFGGMHPSMQPGLNNSGSLLNEKGNKQDGSEAGSGAAQGNLASERASGN